MLLYRLCCYTVYFVLYLSQEEIRFCTSPELIASMLFMGEMSDNEAILIAGFGTYSRYSGYASTLRFAGDTSPNEWVSKAQNVLFWSVKLTMSLFGQ